MEGIKPKAENAPDFRQQNKIIKIIESGNLDALNQPMAAVSGDERESFFKKVREGAVDPQGLDDRIIKHIGAPFTGEKGVAGLLEAFRNNPRLLEDFSPVLQRGLYERGRNITPHQIAEAHLVEFIKAFPTPKTFDAKFIDGRLQGLEDEIKTAEPGRAENLKMELSLQKQLERGTYPRLKAAIYGKRNEYWEQSKLLLKDAQG